jgi:hypothetical protein
MRSSNIVGLELITERLTGYLSADDTMAEILTNDDGAEWITIPVAPEVRLNIVPVGQEHYEITILPAYLGGSHPTTKVGVVAFDYVADVVRVAMLKVAIRESKVKVFPEPKEEVK